MKRLIVFSLLLISVSSYAQREGDSLYARCPVAVLDTASGNNYFIMHQPATVKAYRAHGDFVIVVEQKNQFFTMYFHSRNMRSKKKYSIEIDGGDLSVKYSFRSGESVAFIDVSSGTAITTYDKTTKLWHVVVDGLIASMGDTRVSYFKAKADLYIK